MDSEVVSLQVNGKTIEARPGERLMDVLDAQGIHVPRLCFDPRLKPSSSCRICEVSVKGSDRPLCACATPVRAGMEVMTHTSELEEFRKRLLTLMARTYPAEVLNSDSAKPFHEYLRQYGITPGSESELKPERLIDDSHPYIQVDMDRCITCYRCARICNEVQGQFVWKAEKRGFKTRIVPDSGTTLIDSSCVSCGACVDTCPTGALEDRTFREAGEKVDSWHRTTCPYCGTGCEMNVGVKDDRIVTVRPVLDAPVSKGHLCVKGRYSFAFVDAPDRVLHPMVRKNGQWKRVSWEEALEATARELKRVMAQHGPDAIGVLGSARATNEESFLAHKFSRVVLGTNNVDCCARVCHGPSAAGLGAIFGTGAATNCFDDVERTGAILVVGSNATENHPIVGARIRQRALAGVPMIVIDPRSTELARIAKVHLAPRPGTNIPLLHALAREIIQQGLTDPAFLADRTEGFEEYVKSIDHWTPEAAGAVCGIDPSLIREAARIYGTAKPAMSVHGLGLTEHIQGTDGVIALAHLAMLTGNIGKPGAGVNPLRGQNNVQGTAVMGCEPNKLTGSQPIEKSRDLHEKVWGVKIPATKGIDAMQMIDAAGEGKLKSLLCIGYDLLLSSPNMNYSQESLSKLESCIVVDLFMNETAKVHGTIFLPVASSFEKDGTFMNGERRIQRVRRAVEPRGEVKTDSEVLQLLAARMGHGDRFAFKDASEIWDEVRKLWPAVAGISYSRIESQGLLWPCPSEDHPGTEFVHKDSFPLGPKARFRQIEYRPSAERTTSDYPLILNSGRSLFHFNAATMTGRTRNAELQSDRWVQIHPSDAKRFGISDGQEIRVETRYGSFTSPAWIVEWVRPGELWTTFHHVATEMNRATGPGRDSVTNTPEYKVTAARVSPQP